VTIALGIAITLQVADIALTLSGELESASAAGPSAMREHSPQRASALRALNALVAAHLFGEAPHAATAGAARASRAPLVLTGIIATGDPGDGFAILGTSAATTHAIHAGSQAVPGTILAEVYPQRVVLLRGTERLILTLPKSSTIARFGNAQPGMRTVARSDYRSEVASGEYGIAQRPSPESFRPPPRSDASVLMSAFSMRPVSIGGQRGVRIMGTGINSTTLAALGLAAGDVILQINGGAVGSKGTPNLAEALKSGSATLVVDRGGNATSVTIDADSAATAAQDYRQASPNL
jgi:type II secretory pathway component PulC